MADRDCGWGQFSWSAIAIAWIWRSGALQFGEIAAMLEQGALFQVHSNNRLWPVRYNIF
ncbi:hypothetical protein [Phormidium sp. CCY1219]|uniref:hypothetical protein n=1 Tax=Phormidium sp. CCY1219 TaxID=2886104 RepID=UPI002D1E5BF7|nr:hypothetical protein [Phormidium sp. CCY1219]MEB3828764.1 hypothetical protein [Phormidium sp. CCY1219]